MERLEAEVVPVPRPDTENPLPTQILYSDKEYRGLLWPCTDEESSGTPLLYAGGFPQGKAHLQAPKFITAALPTSAQYPLLFIPGRVLLQAKREMDVVEGKLNKVSRDEYLEIHPEDAAALRLSEGEPVEMAVNGHRLHAKALITDKTHKGTVSSTSLFGQLAEDIQASEYPDPMSKVPGLSISAVTVQKSSTSKPDTT